MTADELLLFDGAAKAARTAVEPLSGAARRERTDRLGQYALDLVADAAVLPILHEIGLAVVSEESGRSGHDDAAITVVLDPVDGSTNCSATSRTGPSRCVPSMPTGRSAPSSQNQATGVRTTAKRQAWRDGEKLAPSTVRRVEDAVIAFSGMPRQRLPWKQLRSSARPRSSCATWPPALDAYLSSWLSPWDYLGGLLVSRSRRAGRRRARQCARRHRSPGAATARGGGDHRAARRSAPGPPS